MHVQVERENLIKLKLCEEYALREAPWGRLNRCDGYAASVHKVYSQPSHSKNSVYCEK